MAPTRTDREKPKDSDGPEDSRHPDATARQVRDFLKSSGTGEQRIQQVDEMIQTAPDSTGKLLLESMIGAGMQTGTLIKAGRYLYGPSFSLASGGPSASTEEMERLQRQNAELERQIRLMEGRNMASTQELLELRGEKQRLTDDLADCRQQLQLARAGVARMSDVAPRNEPAAAAETQPATTEQPPAGTKPARTSR